MRLLGRRWTIVMGLVAAIVLLWAGSETMMAKTASESIKVFYRNIKISVKGTQLQLPAEEEPFIYNGRTYVPLSVVAKALGYDVVWDGKTSTVRIGEVPGEVSFSEIKPYAITGGNIYFNSDANIVMGGKKYTRGVRYDNSSVISRIVGLSEYYYNLNAQYSQLTGLLGPQDGFSGTIIFYGDDKELASYKFEKSDLPVPIALDVSGVVKLTVFVQGGDINLADAVLKK